MPEQKWFCVSCKKEVPGTHNELCINCNQQLIKIYPPKNLIFNLASFALACGAILYIVGLMLGRPPAKNTQNFYSSQTFAEKPASTRLQPSTRSHSSYDQATSELGIDNDRYAREAQSYGVSEHEALAVDLVICRETGDCPAGVSSQQARSYICRKTGDC